MSMSNDSSMPQTGGAVGFDVMDLMAKLATPQTSNTQSPNEGSTPQLNDTASQYGESEMSLPDHSNTPMPTVSHRDNKFNYKPAREAGSMPSVDTVSLEKYNDLLERYDDLTKEVKEMSGSYEILTVCNNDLELQNKALTALNDEMQLEIINFKYDSQKQREANDEQCNISLKYKVEADRLNQELADLKKKYEVMSIRLQKMNNDTSEGTYSVEADSLKSEVERLTIALRKSETEKGFLSMDNEALRTSGNDACLEKDATIHALRVQLKSINSHSVPLTMPPLTGEYSNMPHGDEASSQLTSASQVPSEVAQFASFDAWVRLVKAGRYVVTTTQLVADLFNVLGLRC